MTIADKTFTAPFDIFPQAATGQELGHAANLWDLFTREVTFNAATGANVITVPDNLASAVELVDAGGIEYMRAITTNAQPTVVWNEGGADIDFRWEAVGLDPALFIQGSNGFIGFGGISAPGQSLDGAITASNIRLRMTAYSAGNAQTAALFFRKSSSAVLLTEAVTADGERLGEIRAWGCSSAPAFAQAVHIRFEQDGAAGAVFVPGRIVFRTGTDAALPTTRLTIDSGGDTYWSSDTAGLLYGSMYAAAEIIVVIGGAAPVEVEDAAQDGWTAGELNGVTFPTGGTEHYLTITIPGRYEIIWSMSFHIAAGAGASCHGGVMIDGVAIRDNGETDRDVANLNDTGSMGSPCILDLPNGTEEISLWILNGNSNDIHVVQTTVTVKQIGGT